MKLLSLFAGIGAPEKALSNLGIDFEVVDAVEVDKHAIASYNAIHGTDFKPCDISTWKNYCVYGSIDMIFHGSPCQSFSIAGSQEGGDEGSGTKSSLMYESLRIIRRVRSKYVVWENVKNVLSKKHRHNFDNYLTNMEELGYVNHWKVLNTKDHGLPQNRERIFCVSIFGGDDFQFPEPIPLTLKLGDLMDTDVAEKYYLSDKAITYMNGSRGDKQRWEYHKNDPDNDACCLTANMWKGVPYGVVATLNQIANINNNNSQANRIYSDDMARTIVGEAGGGGAKTGWYITQRSHGFNKGNTHDICPTITTSSWEQNNHLVGNSGIRRLTPLECFRLQGFTDFDYLMASTQCSETQLYKQAGNSISVPVIERIFSNLLKEFINE